MTYLSGKQHKKEKSRRYFLFISLLVVSLFFWTGVKGYLYPVLEPLIMKYGVTKESFSHISEFFSTYTTSRTILVQKNKTLEITIESLENQVAERDVKLKELGIADEERGDANIASIIVMYPLMTDSTRLYSTVLLSKGYKDGVEKDAYVFVRGLQPVCIIREVYTSTSLCELISASNIETDAVIVSSATSSTSTPVVLTLTGRGGGAFLGNVVRDTAVFVGDKVFLKSDQSMMLGTVVNVINNNQDTSWRVFVKGTYNPVTSSIFYMRKNSNTI